MKYFIMKIIAFYILLPITSLGADKEKTLLLNTPVLKASYAFGLESGKLAKHLSKKFDMSFNLDCFFQGIKDQYNEKEPLLSKEEARKAIGTIIKQYHKKRDLQGKRNQEENKMFFAENRHKEGIITTDKGFQYEVLKQGKGKSPHDNDIVIVHYRGRLLNGTEFFDTYKQEKPDMVELEKSIPGWKEAIPLMKVGGQYRIFVPPELAYKEKGRGDLIGPHCALIFDIELLAIQPKENTQEKPMPSEIKGDKRAEEEKTKQVEPSIKSKQDHRKNTE